MITFKQFIGEMAAPSDKHLAGVYYHGTSSEKAGLSILKNGIEPGDIAMPERHKPLKGANLVPVAGKVYITPDLKYAQIYAIGGDIAGWAGSKETGFGYLFKISGSDLKDIQPDEDSIGEMISNAMRDPSKADLVVRELLYLAQQKLTVGQYKKLKDGEYVMYAHTGKKLLPLMSDRQKLAMIDLGAHVAHTGKLIPIEAWKIDLTKIKDLKQDASNFFENAEKNK